MLCAMWTGLCKTVGRDDVTSVSNITTTTPTTAHQPAILRLIICGVILSIFVSGYMVGLGSLLVDFTNETNRTLKGTPQWTIYSIRRRFAYVEYIIMVMCVSVECSTPANLSRKHFQIHIRVSVDVDVVVYMAWPGLA